MRRVLFVDQDNASRSQMAEAFARTFGDEGLAAYSAGVEPAEFVDDRALALMAEVGCDLSGQHTKSLQSLSDIQFDVVVGLGERRLDLPRARLASAHWRIPDPTMLDGARYRDVRHDIGHRVRLLLNALDAIVPAEAGAPIDLGSD